MKIVIGRLTIIVPNYFKIASILISLWRRYNLRVALVSYAEVASLAKKGWVVHQYSHVSSTFYIYKVFGDVSALLAYPGFPSYLHLSKSGINMSHIVQFSVGQVQDIVDNIKEIIVEKYI